MYFLYPQEVSHKTNVYDMRTVPPVKNVELVDLKTEESEKQDDEITDDSPPPYSSPTNYTIPSLSAIHTTV